MITVRGRELVIPVAERQIGTQFDNNSETRQFKINRLTVGGIDISNLDFRIDLRYGKETKDTDVLEKEITDEHVILTWTVSAASVKQVGTVFIALRGSDDFGTVKWATNQGYLYVGDTINTPDGAEMALSELEKLEKRIDQKTESMDAAESSRVEAEKIRQENESARLKNEAEWQKQGEAAVEAAKTATAAQSAASSAAQTATQKASEASSSASAAASDANVVKRLIQGLGGFDGKASSVSAVDLLGLLGKENATSTVQALIDVIADKVLNQLLSRSNVVNNALTTEEGYALDARMGKSLQDQITAQNSNLGSTYGYISDLDVPDVILGVYDVNSANSPYKKGLTQATAGIVLSVYNTNSVYNSQLALSAGNEKFYIRQKGNNTWGEWMAK